MPRRRPGVCTQLATMLDLEMIETRMIRPIPTRPIAVPTEGLPSRYGAEVVELSGRYHIRYLTEEQADSLRHGSDVEEFVTPTPYAPWEAISALALPGVSRPRTHALILDPSRIDEICGPFRCQLGIGVEYILPHGFRSDAIVAHTARGGWAIEVR